MKREKSLRKMETVDKNHKELIPVNLIWNVQELIAIKLIRHLIRNLLLLNRPIPSQIFNHSPKVLFSHRLKVLILY